MNKFHAKRTYSPVCQRWFASMAEAHRGTELALAERAGAISGLEYQVRFDLCKKPKVTITVDFKYVEVGCTVYEDVKGVLTRDFRTKLAWLEQLHKIHVKLTSK